MTARAHAIVATPRAPWPADDGGRIALAQIVEAIATAWDVTLLSMVPRHAPALPLPAELRALGVEVVTIEHVPPPAAVAAVAGLFGPLPYTLARYRSSAFEQELRGVVARRRSELVVLNNLHLASYAPACAPAAVVLRQQNVEHRWLARYARARPAGLVRAYAAVQARRMREAERRLCEDVDLVLSIQPDETDVLRALAPRARIETLPPAVDFPGSPEGTRAEPPVVLLCGAFGWPPNAEGARRFLDSGWPRVRAGCPGARLRLVGKDLPAELAAHARRRGAEPVGYVSAFAPELAGASVLVVPLWVGAGARLKILEALGARTPVVTTTLGCEGLGLAHGRDALIADTAEGLGDAVLELLSRPARAHALASAAFLRAREAYSRDAVIRRTVELCASAVHSRPAREKVPG